MRSQRARPVRFLDRGGAPRQKRTFSFFLVGLCRSRRAPLLVVTRKARMTAASRKPIQTYTRTLLDSFLGVSNAHTSPEGELSAPPRTTNDPPADAVISTCPIRGPGPWSKSSGRHSREVVLNSHVSLWVNPYPAVPPKSTIPPRSGEYLIE